VLTDLRGKTALITGAGSGIGRAMALRFAQDGAYVIVVDRDHDSAFGTRALLGEHASCEIVDVADPEDVEALAERAWRTHGSIDLLCNNAGILGPRSDLVWEIPDPAWRAVLDVNVLGSLNLIRSFVPRMIRQATPAHIVNTASMLGLTRSPVVAPYTASKHALVAITETLALQLRAENTQVGVSMLCPGPVATNLSKVAATSAVMTGQDAKASGLARQTLGYDPTPLDPAKLADTVLDAIHSDRFYVFPNAGSRERIASYSAELLAAFD
jgi:NAD(P)-dependent dehydrogenase (short-subunit alcohol dehydrogenase family)